MMSEFGYACDRCREKHQSCNHELPCKRCVKANLGDQCHYTPKKSRGKRSHSTPTSALTSVNGAHIGQNLSNGHSYSKLKSSNSCMPSPNSSSNNYMMMMYPSPLHHHHHHHHPVLQHSSGPSLSRTYYTSVPPTTLPNNFILTASPNATNQSHRANSPSPPLSSALNDNPSLSSNISSVIGMSPLVSVKNFSKSSPRNISTMPYNMNPTTSSSSSSNGINSSNFNHSNAFSPSNHSSMALPVSSSISSHHPILPNLSNTGSNHSLVSQPNSPVSSSYPIYYSPYYTPMAPFPSNHPSPYPHPSYPYVLSYSNTNNSSSPSVKRSLSAPMPTTDQYSYSYNSSLPQSTHSQNLDLESNTLTTNQQPLIENSSMDSNMMTNDCIMTSKKHQSYHMDSSGTLMLNSNSPNTTNESDTFSLSELPYPSLLDGLHYGASQMYQNQQESQPAKDSSNKNSFYNFSQHHSSMDGSALMATGILVQEFIRDSLSMINDQDGFLDPDSGHPFIDLDLPDLSSSNSFFLDEPTLLSSTSSNTSLNATSSNNSPLASPCEKNIFKTPSNHSLLSSHINEYDVPAYHH